KVASFIGASNEEIVFTKGTTESLNLVRYGWGNSHIKKGDLIVLTIMEHHSNIVPWQLLAKQVGEDRVRGSYGGRQARSEPVRGPDGPVPFAGSIHTLLQRSWHDKRRGETGDAREEGR